jgi:nicotinamidase-related amidase
MKPIQPRGADRPGPRGIPDHQCPKLLCPRRGQENRLFPTEFVGHSAPNLRRQQSACRNLGVRSLIVAGIMTDQCVETDVRGACGYLVTLATDACTTNNLERHHQSLNPVEDTPEVTRQHVKSLSSQSRCRHDCE